MKNVVIIYWSGTGNTQKMALAVAEGVKADGVGHACWRLEKRPRRRC